METGIQYMEDKQNVELAFFENHTRKVSQIHHKGFRKLSMSKLETQLFASPYI